MFVWERETCDPDDLFKNTLPLIARGECMEFTVTPVSGNYSVRVMFGNLSNLIKWIEENYNYSDCICEHECNKLQAIYDIMEE